MSAKKAALPRRKHDAKYVGKLYIDRRQGERPSRLMLERALDIIHAQAPRRHKTQVSFSLPAGNNMLASPERRACLEGTARDGMTVVRVPILAITSAGCSGKTLYYLTAVRAPGARAAHGVIRYWVHAFVFKTRQQANAVAASVIQRCQQARTWRERAAAGGTAPTAASLGLLHPAAGGAHAWHPAFTASSPVSVMSANTDGSPASSAASVTPEDSPQRAHMAHDYRASSGGYDIECDANPDVDTVAATIQRLSFNPVQMSPVRSPAVLQSLQVDNKGALVTITEASPTRVSPRRSGQAAMDFSFAGA